MAEGASGVSFDEDFRIRVLEVSKYNASKNLKEQTEEFTEKLGRLQDTVRQYLEAIGKQAQKIEAEKLRAVGMRNRVSTITEEKERKAQAAKEALREKQEELDRLQKEEASLIRVRQEQEAMIAKLSDNNSGTTLPYGE